MGGSYCDIFSVIVDIADHLEWLVGEWGPCLAVDIELSEVGAGTMDRNVTCVLTSHQGFQVTNGLSLTIVTVIRHLK